MTLKTRVKRLETTANPEETTINVSKSSGPCPTPQERAKIRAANPNKKFIWVCGCENCRKDF